MDRRIQQRVSPEGEIKVRLLTPGRLEEGVLVDLNNAGAFVATDLVVEPGTRVHLELEVPGATDSQPLQAVIVRCSPEIRGQTKVIPAGLGLAFLVPTQAERDLIQQIVISTLTLDLLSYQARPRPTDTQSFGRPVYRPNPQNAS